MFQLLVHGTGKSVFVAMQLILSLLGKIWPSLLIAAEPDQVASGKAIWSGSTLFTLIERT